MYLCFSSLSHPNIVSLYGFVQNEDEVVIVTNFVEGRSLHAMLFGKNKTTVRNFFLGTCICILLFFSCWMRIGIG